MEHASKAANRALAHSSESESRTQARSGSMIQAEQRAAKVWLAMAELYGPAFAAAYGDKPSPLWLAAIAELSDDECRAGLTTLARQPREYPANLTQFVGACRPPSGGVRFLGTPTTPAQLDALLPPPEKRATRERLDGWFAKIRARLAS